MDSLVSPSDVVAHLRLLGAIRSYLFTLSENHVQFVNDVLCPTLDGVVFLRRSVHRLKLWITHILRPKYLSNGCNQELRECELPPFDVLLMLHAYMLHPRSFYEDTVRLYPELTTLKGFPLIQVAGLINEAMEYVANADHVAFWVATTGEEFSPPLLTTPLDKFTVTCPGCLYSFGASWMGASSDGLGTDLSIKCDRCSLLITDETLAVAHFLGDIRRATSGDGVGVAKTLLTIKGVLDPQRSRAISSKIASAIDFPTISRLCLDYATDLLQSIPQSVFEDISVEFLSCYGHPDGFSIDIGAAVLRQTRFASVMYHAGWTNPLFPLQAATTITDCIKRYEGFLKLTMEPGEAAMGPTKEIDLIWHTHQLSRSYRSDCIRLFGWFLDHVDLAQAEVLNQAYSNAGERWEKIFGTPYDGYFQTVRFELVHTEC